MKIISWNCNMAFRKKYEKVLSLAPDLLVLQECENDKKLKDALSQFDHNQVIWHGNNQHKGVAIISFNSIKIELIEDHKLEFEYIIPLKLTNGSLEINLFCIWAMPHKTIRARRYIGQVWAAINYYSPYLTQESILIGDFNSNAIWDEKRRVGNHTDVVNLLLEKDIQSIYHLKNNCAHGLEQDPTFFLVKNIEKTYHMDYCFASNRLISKKTTIKIGQYEEWIKLSDHMPVIIENLKVYK